MKNKTKVDEFLKESNAIEGVFDFPSLYWAKKAWGYLIKEDEITEAVVLKTHKILMFPQLIEEKEKGYFRTVPVWIGRGEGLNHLMIKGAMAVWCQNAHLFPEHWKNHHIRYERIHPFIDGNGRTGRMFMNWQRLKAGLPILVIKNLEKGDYYGWFK